MLEWKLQIATADTKGCKIEKFATKRELLSFVSRTAHTFIQKVAPQTYTIYPKKKGG